MPRTARSVLPNSVHGTARLPCGGRSRASLVMGCVCGGAEARRRDARALVGERIWGVRYYTLDYRRHELHPELLGGGPRIVDAESEWDDPKWLYAGFDALDYGLEVTTDSGTTFSLTWDPPGEREGIGLQGIPMLGHGVSKDADVAISDVGGRTVSWRPMIGTRVTGVDLHSRPWHERSWCCEHRTRRRRRVEHARMSRAQEPSPRWTPDRGRPPAVLRSHREGPVRNTRPHEAGCRGDAVRSGSRRKAEAKWKTKCGVIGDTSVPLPSINTCDVSAGKDCEQFALNVQPLLGHGKGSVHLGIPSSSGHITMSLA